MIVSLNNLIIHLLITLVIQDGTNISNKTDSILRARFHTLAKRINIQRKSNANSTPPLKCTLTFIEHI